MKALIVATAVETFKTKAFDSIYELELEIFTSSSIVANFDVDTIPTEGKAIASVDTTKILTLETSHKDAELQTSQRSQATFRVVSQDVEKFSYGLR